MKNSPMRPCLLAVVSLLGMATIALAMWGADHPKGRVHATDGWPKGLEGLVNTDQRVHGYYVNHEDFFFFRGDTARLNAFLKDCLALPGSRLEVVLHPGHLLAKSPWDKKPGGQLADWKLYGTPYTPQQIRPDGSVAAGPYILRVDVWLGGNVSLDELKVPPGVQVTSGGEIERFIEQHNQRRPEQPAG